MKIKDEGYVLENEELPITFLAYNTTNDENALIDGKWSVKGLRTVQTIQEALFETREAAKIALRYYNYETFHREAPEFNIRKVEITYEI